MQTNKPCKESRRLFLRDCGKELAAMCLVGVGPNCLSAAEGQANKTPASATGVVYDDIYRTHDTGRGHPESPKRYDAVKRTLQKPEFAQSLVRIKPRAATDVDVARCHEKKYIATVKRDVSSGLRRLSTGDTAICPESFQVAGHAAGGVCAAVDAVVGAKVQNAFCAVRPPGHHATPNRGMGFCLFNNAAIAARYAQQQHKIGKVLIVDWDVHHGNGTQDIFYEDGSVFFFSTHQSPWYPGTGPQEETGTRMGKGTTMNRPFPAGSGRKEILGAFRDDLRPAVNRFKPELVIVSAGFDSRIGDPLGRFKLTDEDFSSLTGIVLDIAKEHCDGRLISVLEGGYNLRGLSSAVSAHCQRLQQT